MSNNSKRNSFNRDNIIIKSFPKKASMVIEKPIKNKKSNSIRKKKRKKKKLMKIKIVLSVMVLLLLLAIIFIIVNYKVGFGNTPGLTYSNRKTLKTSGILITDVSNIVDSQIPSLVAIVCKTVVSTGEYGPNYFKDSSYSESSGTGIIIGKTEQELMILTNYHVIENTEEVRVQFIDGKDYIVGIKGYDKGNDIAILTIDLGNLSLTTLHNIKVATIGNSNDLKVGQGVVAIGNSLGYGLSVTTGIVSALNRKTVVDDYNISMIQIDATINVGNSGGALLNGNGELIGITSFKYSSDLSSSSQNVEGIGFAIPITEVSEIITNLMNKDSS